MHCKSYSHFFSKKFQHICVSLHVNFNESLTNDVVSFEQLGPEVFGQVGLRKKCYPTSDYVASDQGLHCLPFNQCYFRYITMIGSFNDAYMIFFSDFLYKIICCGYSFELPRLVEAIQMSTNNIGFYKEADEIHGCNLKTTKCLTVR